MAVSSMQDRRIRNRFIKDVKKAQFGFPFFKKKQPAPIPKPDDGEIQFQKDKPILDRIFSEFFEATKKQTIKLELGENLNEDTDPNGRFKTKIGGIPYWPESMKNKYPNNAVLYAQINFAELPHLEGYPSKGILQFFTDEWIWLGSHSVQYTFYHDNVDTQSPQMEIANTTCNMKDDEAPFEGVFYLKSCALTSMCMQQENDGELYNFNDIMMPIVKKHLGLDIERLYDLPSKHYKYLADKIYTHGWGNRIGGYPNFTQNDVADQKYNTLLLQTDTGNGIMWGDMGISNIFINNIALSKNDFSDVYYNWDCY